MIFPPISLAFFLLISSTLTSADDDFKVALRRYSDNNCATVIDHKIKLEANLKRPDQSKCYKSKQDFGSFIYEIVDDDETDVVCRIDAFPNIKCLGDPTRRLEGVEYGQNTGGCVKDFKLNGKTGERIRARGVRFVCDPFTKNRTEVASKKDDIEA